MQSCDELLGEGFAGLGPEESAGDAAVFFDQQGEREQLFYILLDVEMGFGVERFGPDGDDG